MANRSHKSFFMPMFCRFSINDTVKPAKCSDSSSADPSSPKLSCIGQIKKRSTNTNNININGNDRFLSCRFSASTTGKSSVHSYIKLHRLFSGKNLISPGIDAVSINTCSSKSVTKRSRSCNGRGGKPIGTKKYYMTSSGDQDAMRVTVAEELDPPLPVMTSSGEQDTMRVTVAEELDPPLPVVKTRRGDQEANVNLCKRRGIEMKTLQIQPIQLRIDHNTNNNNGKFSLPTSASTF
ncbi:uncharacterized protein LOC112511701 [Cynara cardunculus var. scolymus]|uniref:uncharacterized protein LOC112511701 n=1 Tax=Cynara cardunculus var. scolymus TaxID=59895 RepID=UPI000D623357|nr:uncharacterized protein LOC112511701 [Cynara cardunculus var. scolymus]